MEEGIDYYLDGGRVVFTELHHIQRGYCCGNKCKHCPYTKPVKKGNTEVNKNLKKDENGSSVPTCKE